MLRSAIPREEQRRRAEIRALNAIRRLLKKVPDEDPKIEALLVSLEKVFEEDPTEKVIVFTEYRDSLEAIRNRLDRHRIVAGHYVVLQGGLSRRQRLVRQEEFERPETRLLLATDAASEGLNLQRHCRRVIHLELPWNPNRLEQRNGRVDRYGQSRNPVIRYLYYSDSPEVDDADRFREYFIESDDYQVEDLNWPGKVTSEDEDDLYVCEEGVFHRIGGNQFSVIEQVTNYCSLVDMRCRPFIH